MEISRFGRKITEQSGIGQLMDDLGIAYSQGRNILMLGGGNPGRIPKVQECFRHSMEKLLKNGDEFERAIGSYDPSEGNRKFIEAVSTLLRGVLGWDIRPENVALTNGSQTAFFILFNIFAGYFEGRPDRKILFPLAPEYIGYCDLGFKDDMFIANKPKIEHLGEHLFKYHVDFDKLEITDEIGAICVSRPTNPTANVLTDDEIERLSELAGENDIPLIIDNAYGMPFPNIIFTETKAIWNEHTIFCMSLSKLGLPALRTGIVIANEQVITMISRMNAVMSLAPGGMGAAMAMDLVQTGEIIDLSRNVITPYYQQKATETLEQVYKELDGIDFHVHKPEGAFFLWLWFPNLPITTGELYERLKARGVLIIPGHHFFPGLKEDWRHKNECIRVNYSQDGEIVTAGIKIIADEVKRAYNAD
jgi:valine--pyruvate aminotransferase